MTHGEMEAVKEVIVDPLVKAVRDEITSIRVDVAAHTDRLNKLESNQSRALVGMAALAVAASSIASVVWHWLTAKLFGEHK